MPVYLTGNWVLRAKSNSRGASNQVEDCYQEKQWNLKFYHDLYTPEQGKKIGQLINVTPRWVAPQLTDTRLPHATIQLKIKQ